MITIFHFDEKTGAYIGQGVAPGNPGDPNNPLIPAHSTTTPPPSGRVRYDQVTGEWVARDSATAEPVAAEPVAAEPVAAEPVAVEPVAVEKPRKTRRRR